MPFCPKCHYEYEPGVAVCPDCDEKLVDRLPDEDAEKEYHDWVALARLHSPDIAEMVIESLRAKDIPAVLKSGVGYFGFVGTQGMSTYAPVGGGYSLLVPQEYVDDAVEEIKVILGDDWEKYKLVDIS
jgi:hypothetical protein